MSCRLKKKKKLLCCKMDRGGTVIKLFSYGHEKAVKLAGGTGLVLAAGGPVGQYVAKVALTQDEYFDEAGFVAEVAAYLRLQQLDSTVPKFLGWMYVPVQRSVQRDDYPVLVLEQVEGSSLKDLRLMTGQVPH